MAEIKVTSIATLSDKATELEDLNKKFYEAAANLQNREKTLRTQYEGEASEAFHEAFHSDLVQMKNFYDAIQKYVEKLRIIADAYSTAEDTNKGIANERTY